jgi:methyltransferase (TIGR00027 family)
MNKAAAFLIALLACGHAEAVLPGAVSSTAAAVCDFRAVGALHPDPKLRNQDRLAAKLCPVSTVLPRDYPLARLALDRDPEGLSGYFFVNARTLHIDAQLVAAAREGIQQVVVLGAGFDSRAYRFHKAYPKLVFFEVDLPAMVAAKKEAIARLFKSLPRHVHYAPIDFNTQTLDAVLAAAGYDSRARSLFIIEGVVMYVDMAGDSATFDFIGRNSAPGSRVVYDYVLRRVVEGDYAGLYGAERLAQGVAMVGEPFVSGWTPAEAAAFASSHGMDVIEDLGDAELTRRYLTNSRGQPDGRMPDWQRIIDARVR